MKTDALKQALDKYGFDAAFGGARRDEEKSRAKERVFSFRSAGHVWDPRNQRPELWKLYNTRINKGETIRVFPLSNWTELDIWQYTRAENIPVVPLYFAAPRPVVKREGVWIMRDDDRLPLKPGETPEIKMVRFRSAGLLSALRRRGEQGGHARRHHRRDDHVRARPSAPGASSTAMKPPRWRRRSARGISDDCRHSSHRERRHHRAMARRRACCAF